MSKIAKIYLEGLADTFSIMNNDISVYGTTNTDTVKVVKWSTTTEGVTTTYSNHNLEIDQNIETIKFDENISNLKFAQTGNLLNVYETDGTTLITTIAIGDSATKVSFNQSSSLVDVAIVDGVMSIDGNDISESIEKLKIAKTASEINTANDNTTDFIDYSDITIITGSVSEIGTMLGNKGSSGDKIGLADDVDLTLTDVATISQYSAIDTATTGTIINNGISDTAANLKTDADTNSGAGTVLSINPNITITDAATISQYSAIDTATTGTILNNGISDTAANLKTDADTNSGAGTVLSVNPNITITDAATISQYLAIDTATTGTIINNGISDTAANLKTDADTNSGAGTVLSVNPNITITDNSTVEQLNAIDLATTGIITATIKDTISGLTTEIKDTNSNNITTITLADTVANLKTDADSNSGDGTILANDYVTTITDVENTSIAATDLSAIGLATDGVVTAANAISIIGSQEEVTAALVTTDSLIVAQTATVTINDASNVLLDITTLSAIGGKTEGEVTVTGAALRGSSSAAITSLVTEETKVIANLSDIQLNGDTPLSDFVQIDAVTNGSIEVYALNATNGTDVFKIDGNNIFTNLGLHTSSNTDTYKFINATDKLDFTAYASSVGTLAKSAVAHTDANNITVDTDNTTIYVIDSDATDLDDDGTDDTIGNFSSMSDVATFLNAGFTTNNEANETHFFVINDGSESTNAFIYKFTDSGDNTEVDATELKLIGSMTTDDSATTVDDITIA